jgi:hypothetical protein
MTENSYVEFYKRDSLLDLYKGEYAALYDAYAPPSQTYEQLHLHFGLANEYAVFACLSSDNRIHLFHRLARHTTPLGITPSACEEQVVAIQGDLTGVGANYVTVPRIFFSAMDVTNIPTADDIHKGLKEDTTCLQLAAQVGDSGYRVVTRRAMLVPPPYAPALFKALARTGSISPRFLWSVARRILKINAPIRSCRAVCL